MSGNPTLTSLAINPQARTLSATGNTSLTGINFNGATLNSVNVSGNALQSLVIPTMDGMQDEWTVHYLINVSDNPLQSFSLPEIEFAPDVDFTSSFLFNMSEILINNTLLETLDFHDPIYAGTLSVANNPNLSYLSFRNGSRDMPLTTESSTVSPISEFIRNQCDGHHRPG